jgi:ATP-dependent Clp protease ATP-binding subunit ClpC
VSRALPASVRARADTFTDTALASLSYAQDEAWRLSAESVGAEHLLLGLMRVSDGLAARVLRGLGADARSVRQAVDAAAGGAKRTGGAVEPGELDLSAQASAAVERAIGQAGQLHQRRIATAHLLLGLLADADAAVLAVFQTLAITPEQVREAAVDLVTQPPEA